ncbi:hypothetical protein [Vibrio algarum]|uniref:Lipoprotein n=1 Tax=Vibrio algarum TaxID=3020714 RepID=A0ABT4YV66_9VIBR|nr:hypothetical protein [Vibrio sp. KJ40-1]MDB1125446.1 hypothetical protein [Vibrio sp. KJ40-1]
MGIINKACGLLVVFTLLITGCLSNTKNALQKANLSPGVTYQVQSFDVDLTYKLNVPGFLDQEHTKKVMEASFNKALENAGLLAQESDKNTIPIYIYIDYRRIFTGEATPFPIDKVGSPYFYFQITTKNDTETFNIYQSKELSLSISMFDFADLFKADKNIATDVKYSMSIGHNIAKQLIEKTPGHNVEQVDDILDVELNAFVNSTIRAFEEQEEARIGYDYIPDIITKDFVARLTSDKYKVRKSAYKEIQKSWFNQDPIFGLINDQLLASYKQDLSDEALSEAKYQIETLALSGLASYTSTLSKIAQNAKSEQLIKEATEGLETLKSRSIRASAIHKPLPENMTLEWQQHQFYNMIRSNDLYLQKLAVKRIYKKYPRNEILLDELSLSLDNARSRSVYKAILRSDYHAWICRVLGMSGNKKYKAKLDYMAMHANTKKVRNFAEEFAEELE